MFISLKHLDYKILKTTFGFEKYLLYCMYLSNISEISCKFRTFNILITVEVKRWTNVLIDNRIC